MRSEITPNRGDVTIRERRFKALALRDKGLSYRKIAEELQPNYPNLNYTKSSAYKDVTAAWEIYQNEFAETGEFVRMRQQRRLDGMYEEVQKYMVGFVQETTALNPDGTPVLDGNDQPVIIKQWIPPNIEHVEKALKILDRERKLYPWDKVKKVELSGPNGTPLSRQLADVPDDELERIVGNLD